MQRSFLILSSALLLIFAGGCGPSQEETELKEKQILEEKDKQILEEKYIAENTQSKYLYCPVGKGYPSGWKGEYYLIQLNTFEGNFTTSMVHQLYALQSIDSYDSLGLSVFSRSCEPCEKVNDPKTGKHLKTFVSGNAYRTRVKEDNWKIYDYSKSYGHEVLEFLDLDYFAIPVLILDRVDLRATSETHKLGDDFNANYMCEFTSKEIFEEKIQKHRDIVAEAADALRTEIAERASKETQI